MQVRENNFRLKCMYVAVMLRRMMEAIINKDAMDDKVISINLISIFFFLTLPELTITLGNCLLQIMLSSVKLLEIINKFSLVTLLPVAI